MATYDKIVSVKFNEQVLDELKMTCQDFLQTVAEKVRDEAKEIVPVDTGKLRDSIAVFDGDTKNDKYVGTITTTYAIYAGLKYRL